MTRRNFALTAFVVLLVLVATAGLWLWHGIRTAAMAPGTASIMQEIEIPQGSSLRAVLRELEERELILSARRLEWYL
ncbi:MAG TPA: hypothetical protein VMK82_06595, partial [Steroidobacteraceae bacterium]|nr:hypothetical protein [Steroidobacteraceae bacterium]